MPSISKIRFTNVVYENGDKRYNDDIFEFDGENGAVLLENGGGKTVFVQTALQAVVPNVSVSDRKIKNTLLLENSPAHIAVEWIINEKPRKYALTSVTLFMKNGEAASYKYVYEYDEGDDESIENIPFVIENQDAGKRASSKDEINEYYVKMSQNRMNAHTFVTKKDYCDYIEDNFKIIPSEWQKIAEINGAEGGVEEFFDACKTTGQLVDNLLIPTVEDALAGEGTKAFADIFEKQREHLKQSKQLRTQISESRTVCDRINEYVNVYKDFSGSQEELDNRKLFLKAIYDFENKEKDENIRKNAANIKENEDNFQKEQLYNMKRASYELRILEDKKNEQYKKYKDFSEEYENLKNINHELLQKYSDLQNAAFKYKIKSEADIEEAEKRKLRDLEQNKEMTDIQSELKENSEKLNGYFKNEENKLKSARNEYKEELSQNNTRLQNIEKHLKEAEKKNNDLNSEKSKNEGQIKVLENDMVKIENAILSNKDKENIKDHLLILKNKVEYLEKNLYDYTSSRNVLKNEKINENNNLNDLRKDLDKEKEINSEFASDIKNIEIKMEEILKYIKEFKSGWFNYDKENIYLKQESILSQIETRVEILRDEKEKCIINERISHRYSDDYKDSEYFTADFYLERLIKKLREDIGYVESGSEYIKKYSRIHDVSIDSLTDTFKYWPITLITSEGNVSKIVDIAEKLNENISYPIIVMSEKEAKKEITEENTILFSNVVIPGLWKNNSDKILFEKWKSEILNKASESTKIRKDKETEFNNACEILKKVRGFYEYCPFEHYKEINALIKNSNEKIRTLQNTVLEKENHIKEIDEEIERINLKEKHDNSEISIVEGQIQKCFDYIGKYNEVNSLKEVIKRIQNEIEGVLLELEKLKKDIDYIKDRIKEKEKDIDEVERNIKELKKDVVYNEVKDYEPVLSDKSVELLKRIRQDINDRLNKKNKDRSSIVERIRSAEEKREIFSKQYEDFKKKLDEDININDALETKQGDEAEIERLNEKILNLKEPLRKKQNEVVKIKSLYDTSYGGYNTQKEKYLNEYERIIEFDVSCEEISNMLYEEKKEIDSKTAALLKEGKKIQKEKDEIEKALYKLEVANGSENFLFDNTKSYELTEEEKQNIPYKRISSVEEHIKKYKDILTTLYNKKEYVVKEKEKFIKFCEDKINDVRLKEMSVSGVRTKDTLQDIEKWQYLMNERILRAIEMAENDIREHDKEIQQFINHIHSYLVTVCEELRSIPKKTRIKIDDVWKEVFIFEVPSWEEKEGRKNISEYIDFVISALEDDKFKDENNLEDAGKVRKEIEKYLVTKQLLKIVMGDKDIKVKCRKVTNDGKMLSAPFSWQVSNSWSGGEKWSKNMSLFLGILNYTAEKRQHIKPSFNKKHYRSVIVDNPFGKASSEHVLNPVFFIAEQLGFQIIALTAHAEGKFIRSYFPVVYSLKLRNSKNNTTQIITKEKEIKYAYFKDRDSETLVRMGGVKQTSFLN